MDDDGKRVADMAMFGVAEGSATLPDIAIVGVDNINGHWQFSLDNGKTWSAFSDMTGHVDMKENARWLSSTDRIRFVSDDGR